MTILEAINMVLSRNGRGTVSTPDPDGADGSSDAASIERSLIERSKQVQLKGWHSNRLHDVELTADADGNMFVPDSTLWIDTFGSSAHIDVAQVGGRLYDKDNNTFTFPVGTTLTVEYVVFWEFHCLPHPVANWVAITVARQFNEQYQKHQVTRQTRDVKLGREEREARSDAEHFESETEDFSILDLPEALDMLGRRRRI